jgi:hypothetical protein
MQREGRLADARAALDRHDPRGARSRGLRDALQLAKLFFASSKVSGYQRKLTRRSGRTARLPTLRRGHVATAVAIPVTPIPSPFADAPDCPRTPPTKLAHPRSGSIAACHIDKYAWYGRRVPADDRDHAGAIKASMMRADREHVNRVLESVQIRHSI